MRDADAERQKLVAASARVASRDRCALGEVYEMTSAKLFGICLRISADRDAAQDILQDVYIKVWSRAGRFDFGRARPMHNATVASASGVLAGMAAHQALVRS
ncbi:sigma factor [Novosphingobium sp. KA1]|uniref:sigma factor n=1 Tax=Novosphingobium sp. (strain KA1) TaxID=164608 RepID=UPI001A8F4B10|nr:sigma factor [Novosphingobium sp. KA1]QSR19569.1 hypothetical protein CA833_20645 [Novosphingobium sp. KA1]